MFESICCCFLNITTSLSNFPAVDSLANRFAKCHEMPTAPPPGVHQCFLSPGTLPGFQLNPPPHRLGLEADLCCAPVRRWGVTLVPQDNLCARSSVTSAGGGALCCQILCSARWRSSGGAGAELRPRSSPANVEFPERK